MLTIGDIGSVSEQGHAASTLSVSSTPLVGTDDTSSANLTISGLAAALGLIPRSASLGAHGSLMASAILLPADISIQAYVALASGAPLLLLQQSVFFSAGLSASAIARLVAANAHPVIFLVSSLEDDWGVVGPVSEDWLVTSAFVTWTADAPAVVPSP
jgi:hypothetical protein